LAQVGPHRFGREREVRDRSPSGDHTNLGDVEVRIAGVSDALTRNRHAISRAILGPGSAVIPHKADAAEQAARPIWIPVVVERTAETKGFRQVERTIATIRDGEIHSIRGRTEPDAAIGSKLAVTLHVARTASIGKTKMEELADKRFPQLQADLAGRLSADRRVLFCVHKHVEHLVPEKADLGVQEVGSAHWGALDGSNKYKDFDTAVIFGLPFRDRIWGTGVFFAFQGVQDDAWHDYPCWKEHTNVRELLQRRHLATSIIQAIGRVRLRKVVDEHGRCAPTDVFIVLPTGERGTEILQYIRQELPNVTVQDWPFDVDGPKVRVKRKGLPHERLVTFMAHRNPGRTYMNLISREFGLKPHERKDLQKVLRDEDHATTLALKAVGVTYGSEGKGRGAKSFLVKAA
jgi:hypothetical protein